MLNELFKKSGGKRRKTISPVGVLSPDVGPFETE